MGEARVRTSPELADRSGVYRDRAHAGQVLAAHLEPWRGSGAIVLAIPAGGVPVGAVVAAALGLALDLAVTSKITLPWDSEVGYGAVAFDGSVLLNHRLLPSLGLGAEAIADGTRIARDKVERRLRTLRGGTPPPELRDRPVLVVDDGLASGITMTATVGALARAGASEVVVAVPTGHAESVRRLARTAPVVCCPNIRSGMAFAVADAYRSWRDVSEEEARGILERARGG